MNNNDPIWREVTEKELLERKPFSHFGWEGNDAFSFETISDGYWEAAKIILREMDSNIQKIEIIDTLIYPLFFNYRHSIETYLKALFFNHGNHTDEEKQIFLKKGHNLQSLWSNLRPTLNAGKKHVGSSVNLIAIEDYIKEINQFDPDSMVMRYPVSKDLKNNKGRQYRIDFMHFGKSMDKLCNNLRLIGYDISNQMDEIATLEEVSNYLEVFTQYKVEIDGFLSLLEKEKEKEKEKEEEFKGFTISFSDSEFLSINEEISQVDKFLQDCASDLLILLNTLFYGGRAVNERSVQLSTSPIRKQEEFIHLCNEISKKDGLSFGTPPQEHQINIKGKQPSALIAGISTSISILTLECENNKKD